MSARLGKLLPPGVAKELSDLDAEMAKNVGYFDLEHRHLYIVAVWCMREIAKLRNTKS
jgi:hypothetical protein